MNGGRLARTLAVIAVVIGVTAVVALTYAQFDSWTDTGSLVSVQGYPDPLGQSVYISGRIQAFRKGDKPQLRDESVAEVLAAIDEAGPKNMIAKIPGAPAWSYYSLSAVERKFLLSGVDGQGPGIIHQAMVFLWDGNGFVILPAADARRAYDDRYVYLKMTGSQPVSFPGSAVIVGISGYSDVVYLLVPRTGEPLSRTTPTSVTPPLGYYLGRMWCWNEGRFPPVQGPQGGVSDEDRQGFPKAGSGKLARHRALGGTGSRGSRLWNPSRKWGATSE